MNRKIVLCLFVLILLAGCSPQENEIQTTNSIQPSPSVQPSQPVPESTGPVPTEAIDLPEVFRVEGFESILGIIPTEYRLDIPLEELDGANASLDDKSCYVAIEWATDRSIKDVAGLLSEKLPYELVKSDDDWRNLDGDNNLNMRLKESDSGLSITYILPLDRAAGTLLTDGFSLENFSELPEELAPDAAQKSVSYDDMRAVWRYQLTWQFTEEAVAVTDNLSSLFESNEGYKKSDNDGRVSVEYDISKNEKMVIEWRKGDESSIIAVYEYTMPGHLESELMQTLLGREPSVLVIDVPEECLEILYEAKGASLTYYAMDGGVCYSMTGPNNDDHPFAEKAELLTGAPLTQNEHGGYNFTGDGYCLTIKFGQGKAAWDYEIEAAEGFTHPYIHDIYPEEYEPELPEALKEKPYSMATRYSVGDETAVEMEKTYVIDDKEAAEEALDALKEALADYSGFDFSREDGRTSLTCNIREYNFSCVLEPKDERLLLKITFRYRQ